MSDGKTIEEAIANAREALRDRLEVFRESGRKTKPSTGPLNGASACPGPSTQN